MEERLDKARASIEWSELYPTTKVRHVTASYSDHDPILVDTAASTPTHRQRKKLHRFEEKWVTYPESWSRTNFGNTSARLNIKQQELVELVERGYGQNAESINGVKREINELLHHEEVFWQQRSRSIWLSARDKNTRYFHQKASQRRRKNNIKGLHDSDETWHIDSDRIAKIAEDYYRQLFTSSNPTNMEGVLDVVDRGVTDEMAHSLIQPYIEDELRVALF
uniref:Uncharacterized protein n=1 Tax=Quercus lobata TaxID=97700 RepID=A0A7N2QZ73_QUELO